MHFITIYIFKNELRNKEDMERIKMVKISYQNEFSIKNYKCLNFMDFSWIFSCQKLKGGEVT